MTLTSNYNLLNPFRPIDSKINHINFQHFWLMQLITEQISNLGKQICRASSLDNNNLLDKILLTPELPRSKPFSLVPRWVI